MKQRYSKAGIETLCRLFGKTRYAYYDVAYRSRERLMQEAIIIKLVEEIRENMPKIGTRKIHYLLQQQLQAHEISIGRDSLFCLLERYGLLLRRRKRSTSTTNSRHRFKRYPNMVEHLIVNSSELVWVSDITYLRLKTGFCYLSLITDAYSRKIVGYCLHRNLETEGCIQALEMAIESRNKTTDLIHHSDRGIQYCSKTYVDLLGANKIFISMTERGEPYENALAERINGILKNEFRLGEVFASFESAKNVVRESIITYNEQRPHASCNYLTPSQAHLQQGILEKKWKHYPFRKRNGFIRHDTESMDEKDQPLDWSHANGSDYSSIGCSPAEPTSASSDITNLTTFDMCKVSSGLSKADVLS